jgi:hypothetical protein
MKDSLIGRRPKVWFQEQAATKLNQLEGTVGDFDLDHDPVVSESLDGAYVMCWVWIRNELDEDGPANR